MCACEVVATFDQLQKCLFLAVSLKNGTVEVFEAYVKILSIISQIVVNRCLVNQVSRLASRVSISLNMLSFLVERKGTKHQKSSSMRASLEMSFLLKDFSRTSYLISQMFSLEILKQSYRGDLLSMRYLA